MEQNKPHNLVLALLFIFLSLGLLTAVFFANKQRQLFRSRAQQPAPAVVTGAPGQPPGSDPVEPRCKPAVKEADMTPCGDPASDLVSQKVILRSFTCLDGSTHQGDGICKSHQERYNDMINACGCFERPTTPASTPGPTRPTQPTPACQEGVEDIMMEECPISSQPGPQPGPDDTNVPGPGPVVVTDSPDGSDPQLAKARIITYKCYGENPVKLETECLTDEQIQRTITGKIELICRGKRAPECSVTPPVSVPPDSCSTKSRGDCNCDGKTDLADFECWRKEFNVYVRTNACGAHADFNGDRACTLPDFEVLRQNLFQ